MAYMDYESQAYAGAIIHTYKYSESPREIASLFHTFIFQNLLSSPQQHSLLTLLNVSTMGDPNVLANLFKKYPSLKRAFESGIEVRDQ